MKIEQVKIDKDLAESRGLKPINMSGLGQTVLIAGANGSGKTRLFELINQCARNRTGILTLSDYNNFVTLKKDATNNLPSLREEFEIIESKLSRTAKKNEDGSFNMIFHDLEVEKSNIQSRIWNWEGKLEGATEKLLKQRLIPDEYRDSYGVSLYFPKITTLQDNMSSSLSSIRNSISQLSKVVSSSESPTYCFQVIHSVCHDYYTHTHPKLRNGIDTEYIKKAKNDYKKLQKFIVEFLGEEFTSDPHGSPQIFGMPLGKSKLSDGQKILIQIAVLLFCHSDSLDDFILMIDEPENHLHPKVLLEVLDKIVSINQKGQIWIATHSINVLAHFHDKDLWFMHEGGISFAGREPNLVLKSLVGNQSEIERIHQFISLPALFASNHYAFESLKYPLAVITGNTDPQAIQVNDAIHQIRTKKSKLKLLEFGIGKGRLLRSFTEINKNEEAPINEWLDFVGYDKFDYDKDTCKKFLSGLYKDDEKRYYNDLTKLISDHESLSFDAVLMVNVLHEIPPSDWIDLFREDAALAQLLKKDGLLIVVEDQSIPTGEKAYNEGFIVFDVPEFKILFKSTGYTFESERDGRLKVHIFNKADFLRMDRESIIKALRSLQLRSRKEIEEIRKKESTYKNGIKHGFWLQQFANTSLVLSKFGEE